MATLKNSAAKVLSSATVTVNINGATITCSPSELPGIMAALGAAAAPAASPATTPAVASEPTFKPFIKRAGGGCMLHCPDGVSGATPTCPPSGVVMVDRKEYAKIENGVAVIVPAKSQGYTAAKWERNAKGTGYHAWSPRKAV